ncbi:GAF domain-containing protein [Leptolyngbya sp. FACHB-16]|uniref:PAS domain-containing sensor histidine kinase n=1 Tax=unclassified Leptolyngbya TaxID=2650499 RepID=UPI001688A875|nr:GAF domain-containing protein [Leptolyngbya sp. FACHB-16]MBD2154316.1 GAF domain-containing protein [Leptolyngbya sp. FACHB-16]
MNASHPEDIRGHYLRQSKLSTGLDSEFNGSFLQNIWDSVAASIFVVDVLKNGDFRYAALNPSYERLVGMRSQDVQGKSPEQVLPASEAAAQRQHYRNCVRFGQTVSYEERFSFKGIPSWWITTLTPVRGANSKIHRLIGTSIEITERKQAEETLRLQAERERLVSAIAHRIRESLDLNTILNRAVTEVRQFLQTDRVLIYRFEDDGSGVVMVESVGTPWRSVLGNQLKDPCFAEKHFERYRQGYIQVIEDIYAMGLHPCYIELLAAFQVRANLVVPVVTEQTLWGLLVVQHCQGERQWQQIDIDLLKQLALQIGIAVQQAELHHQVQCLNVHLEKQVQQRTIALQQALTFETIVRQITERIRDSLDEQQILQTVTQELGQVLQLNRCKIELYDRHYSTAIVAYEYTTHLPDCQGKNRRIDDFLDIYQPLLEKKTLQFTERVPALNLPLGIVTRLACPIFVYGSNPEEIDQEVLGNLWLFRPRGEVFYDIEIQLAQQIANQCAIAIRQVRLYQSSQLQVTELEKLNRLKDEFLKTLSHELRTPITSISLAAQTLETILEQAGVFNREDSTVKNLFEMLHQGCQRETKMIADLLTLSHLDAETAPPSIEVVDLHGWLPTVAQKFEKQISQQNQQLYIILDSELPPLLTDTSDVERIVVELLTNACKYTPRNELISVTAYTNEDTVQISVSNTGIEIETTEINQIFNAFYRIPNHDPWQYSGAGLGLALVKKLVERLGASVEVESASNQTTFTVKFPYNVATEKLENSTHCRRVITLGCHSTSPAL